LRQYNEEIDKTIIEILHKNGEMAFGKLEYQLKQCIKSFSYETYSGRLKQLCEISQNSKQTRYAIQPVLEKKDKGRGKNVLYSLTKNAKIRYDLKLPILKNDTLIEKAYRILFYYMIFFYNQITKLKDEDEYNAFLEKLCINKNELEYQGRNIIKDKDSKENIFEFTNWIHIQSEIRFKQKHYLKSSGEEGKYEYFYMLPGISPSEFIRIRERGLVYQELNCTKDEVIQYFELLEKHNLIKKLQSYPLMILNKERYIIIDDLLQELLVDCWTLQSHVSTYLEYVWKSLSKPTNEERIWYAHLWGKSRSEEWFRHCYHIRREYKEKNNQVLKETQGKLDEEKSEIIKKFDSIKNEYAKIINDYLYFIKPLLNVVYPEFLRKDFNQ